MMYILKTKITFFDFNNFLNSVLHIRKIETLIFVHDIAAVNKQVKDKSFLYWLTLYTHHYSEKDTQSENN